MKNDIKTFFAIVFLLSFSGVQAQSGGPPMLTDDPGVVDYKHWEINISANTSLSNNLNKVEIPFIDINYGVYKNLQLKIEFPYTFYFPKNQKNTSGFGDATFGIKLKILDEENYFLSVGTYPQYTFYGERGLLLPLLFEKTLGQFLIGEDLGAFWGEHGVCVLHSSTLLGYKVFDYLEIMGEFYIEKDINSNAVPVCDVNFGCRYTLSEHIGIMASFGTQVSDFQSDDREKFFSFVGIRWSF